MMQEENDVLVQVEKLEGCRIVCTDGPIGKLEEIYFDDHDWIVRYLIVDTGGWLMARDVLISPHSVDRVDRAERTLALNISRHKVRNSPAIGTDLPVSRQLEADYLTYYGYTQYWPTAVPPPAGVALAGNPPNLPRVSTDVASPPANKTPRDMHLRSSSEVTGYRVAARDRRIGRVADFLVDDETWVVRFLIVETGHWLPGKRVLIPPRVIHDVDWARGEVAVNCTREQIKASPEFDPAQPPAGKRESTRESAHSAEK